MLASALAACAAAQIRSVAELEELAAGGNLAAVGFNPLTAQRLALQVRADCVLCHHPLMKGGERVFGKAVRGSHERQ